MNSHYNGLPRVQMKLDTWDGITGRVKQLIKEQHEEQLEKLRTLLQDHVAGPSCRRDAEVDFKFKELTNIISSSRTNITTRIVRLENEIRAVASEVAKNNHRCEPPIVGREGSGPQM